MEKKPEMTEYQSMESSQLKISIAAFVLRQGGDVILNPPFILHGIPINRIVAQNTKTPSIIAYFDEKLGGSLTPGFRIAFFTSEDFRTQGIDLSIRLHSTEYLIYVFEELLLWLKSQYVEPVFGNKTWSEGLHYHT